jgi:hypothetical protein
VGLAVPELIIAHANLYWTYQTALDGRLGLRKRNEPTDVVVDGKGLKVSAHDTVVSGDAQVLIDLDRSIAPASQDHRATR